MPCIGNWCTKAGKKSIDTAGTVLPSAVRNRPEIGFGKKIPYN
jgi:hypothetical protein